jgi:hypothetical protein
MKKLSPPSADGLSQDQDDVGAVSKLDNTRSSPSPASIIPSSGVDLTPAGDADLLFSEFAMRLRRAHQTLDIKDARRAGIAFRRFMDAFDEKSPP